MDCAELARSLDAFLDAELSEPEHGQVEEHLASCPGCWAQADSARRFRDALRTRLRSAMGAGAPEGRAPPELRSRIHLALVESARRSGAGSSRRCGSRRSPPAPPGCCWSSSRRMDEPARRRGDPQAHARPAARGDRRSGRTGVGGRLVRRQARLQSLAAPVPWRGCAPRRCAPVPHPGAARRPTCATTSRAARPDSSSWTTPSDVSARRVGSSTPAPPPCDSSTRRGYNVAMWRRNGIVYSLVSDLDEEDLFRLVADRPGALGDK